MSNWLNWRDVGSRGELGVRVVGAAATGVHIQQFSRGCTRDIYSADDGKPFTSGVTGQKTLVADESFPLVWYSDQSFLRFSVTGSKGHMVDLRKNPINSERLLGS